MKKTAVIILLIGATIYYALYGGGPIEGWLKERDREQKAEAHKSLVLLKAKHWRASHRVPINCQNPRTELKKLECKNAEDNARQAFDRKWDADTARGWKPAPM